MLKFQYTLKYMFGVALLLLAMNGFAIQTQTPSTVSDFGIGIDYATLQGSDAAIMLVYANEYITAAMGGNYGANKDSAGKRDWINYRARLGLRHKIEPNIYLTYGIAGGFNPDTASEAQRPYYVGAFVGIDYKISQHFTSSVKILPYSYERQWNNEKHTGIFENVAFGLSYHF